MWGVNCLKQDLQDLSDLQDWKSLLPKTPIEDSEFKSVMWGVNCLKQDLQDLSDLQDWKSLLPKTPIIELPNYLFKLHLSNFRY